MSRTMNLIAYLKTGPSMLYAGGWRHPEARLDDIFSPRRYEYLARLLEDARFDGCFFADTFGLSDVHGGSFDSVVRSGGQISYLDPMTVLPVMAAATSNLGLGATLSTSFFHPYHLARSLMSLDLMSNGRAAWNVVTSTLELEAKNFGVPWHDKDVRYDIADEVLEACEKLWRSWDDDALIMDKESGIFADPSKVHYANYVGKWVESRGPISIPRSPQGQPVLMQAGSSERGRQFAARWAEIVFAIHRNKAKAMPFYRDIKDRVEAAGRNPDHCRILIQATCVVAETDEIAREKAEFAEQLASEELRATYASTLLATDLTKTSGQSDISLSAAREGSQGLVDLYRENKGNEGATIQDAAKKIFPDIIHGSADTVADVLEDLFVSKCCDGFVITPITLPGSHEAFARAVVPKLQKRGLFRKEYSGKTMRANLIG